jgi:hypothetical protein
LFWDGWHLLHQARAALSAVTGAPDDERRRLEYHYSRLFVEDNRFNRQVVSFQASKGAILHSWIMYREGFSAFLVDTLLQEFQVEAGERVLEPFAGSSTTLLVCKMRGINADGIEILPNCHLSWDAKSRYSNYDLQELTHILDVIENGCVPFELKVRLQSGKVSFAKNTLGRSHDLQLRKDYTRCSCSI